MNWISYSDLHVDVEAFAATLPNDVTGIIGVPRAGMLAATLLGLHLHLPVIDIQSFSRGLPWKSGLRLGSRDPAAGGKLVILDDSYSNGYSLRDTKAALAQTPRIHAYNFLFCALYSAIPNPPLDHFHRHVSHPRVMEWNMWTKPEMHHCIMDIDGVLCYDPTVFDDDGHGYQEDIRNATPLYKPRFKVPILITCRLERWRGITEAWLVKQRIKYTKLVMYPANSAHERRAKGDHGQWKATHYSASNIQLFIESSKTQADIIFKRTSKPVLCMENKKLYQ